MKITYSLLSTLLISSSVIASENKEQLPTPTAPMLKERCLDAVAALPENKIMLNSLPLSHDVLPKDLEPEMSSRLAYVSETKQCIQSFLKKYVWLTKSDNQSPTEISLNQLTSKQVIYLLNLSLCEGTAWTEKKNIDPVWIQTLSQEWKETVQEYQNAQSTQDITAAISLFSRFNNNHFMFNYTPTHKDLSMYHTDRKEFACMSPCESDEARTLILENGNRQKNPVTEEHRATYNIKYLHADSLPLLK